MNWQEETYNTWNKVAGIYQDKFMNLGIYNESYDRFSALLIQPDAAVLDVACGPGNISKYLLNKRTDLNITGIDFAPDMIALAIRNNPKADYKVLDIRLIKELTTNFNGIICGFCVPYLSPTDVVQFIADCSHLLLHRGIIYLSFVEGKPEQSGFQTGSSGDRVYFHFHEVTSICRLLQDNNFELVDTFKVPYPKQNNEEEIHTILIAQKRS